ncbi:MAG: hypothetical protein ACPGGG_00275 [Parvibaculales bacterium]
MIRKSRKQRFQIIDYEQSVTQRVSARELLELLETRAANIEDIAFEPAREIGRSVGLTRGPRSHRQIGTFLVKWKQPHFDMVS